MKDILKVGSILAFTGLASTAQAGLVDFESFTTNNYALATNTAFNTGDNAVSFFAKSRTGVNKDVYVIKSGKPTSAYVPRDLIPAGYNGGSFFLSDEMNGPSTKYDYYMSFDKAIDSLSLAVYDYGAFGGPQNDSLTLNLYDIGMNIVGSYTTTPGGTANQLPDPNLILMSATATTDVYYASVNFAVGDVGTGIDNISFNTVSVSEPGTLGLFGLGLLGTAMVRRRQK